MAAARTWWTGRYGARLLVEVALLVVGWRLYRLGRYAVRDQVYAAFENAHRVIDVQALIGLGWEPAIQRAVIGHIEAVNWYYVVSHFPVTLVVLAWLYVRRHEHYGHIRRSLVGATALGLAGHVLFPLAPPRMVPEMGMVDTLAVYGPRVYSHDVSTSITNQFAAMPSLHVGWAVLMAYAVVRAGRSRWRWLVLVHPLVMMLSVTATANHYVLDGLVGAAVVAVAVLVDRGVTAWIHRHRHRHRAGAGLSAPVAGAAT